MEFIFSLPDLEPW